MPAPSGAVVLACAGFLSEWADLGEPLSVRALRAAQAGGACLRDWLAEAVAAPAGAGLLTVSAETRPGTYEPAETIAVLEIGLGLPWPGGTGPIVLGDLPVDRGGMVIGDARALDSWVGFLSPSRSVDGLADVRIWGRGAAEAVARFTAPSAPGDYHGWFDLPVEVARERAAAINRWAAARNLYEHLAHVDPHNHHYLGQRAGRPSPLGAGVIEVEGCPVLCVNWSPAELQRFGGGRAFGQVYPLTLEEADGGSVLRWRIPAADVTGGTLGG
ncbi:hypothetical protein ACQPZJ_21870 [Actinoplanes sp. CA-054009]